MVCAVVPSLFGQVMFQMCLFDIKLEGIFGRTAEGQPHKPKSLSLSE